MKVAKPTASVIDVLYKSTTDVRINGDGMSSALQATFLAISA